MNQQPRTKNYKTRTDNDVVVSVKNVSKKFCKNLKRSMAHGIVDLSKNLVGIKQDTTKLRKDEFWALDNISFELRRGETLGLIGVNGSGKTTLLRLLAGIFPPDKGEIMVNGRVGALIAVGAGFHPHMTGRENIYLNGTILGMTREEIDSEFENIVDFAEIGDFLDAPVSTYSSGMRVRLGFSIATAIKPDVLLIDEILAVGDRPFQVKCFNRISELSDRCAIIFVSHNLQQVSRVTSEIILFDHGKIVCHCETNEGIQKYNTLYSGINKGFVKTSDGFNLIDFQLKNRNIIWNDDLFFRVKFYSKKNINVCKVRILILDQNNIVFAEWKAENYGITYTVTQGRNVIEGCLPQLKLRDDKYYITFVLSSSNNVNYYIDAHCCSWFIVSGRSYGNVCYQI